MPIKQPEPPSKRMNGERNHSAANGYLNDFDALRAVLLHDEREAIAEINKYLKSSQQRKIDVANVLPEAFREAGRNKNSALIDAMREPVVEAVAVSARRGQEDLSNALAPVIGPAIIRSVSETLKHYTESIEAIASNNLTLRGLKWRLEARRSGVSFSEIVLKHTLLYRVEQVFLIHKPSGLLIAHVDFSGQSDNTEKDAIAGMMSAIHSFSRDSLLSEHADSLEAIDLGGRQLRLLQGSHAMLACVTQGKVPIKFVEQAKQVLGELHRQFHHEMRDFNGDPYLLANTRNFLEPLLIESKSTSSESDQNNKPKHQLRWGFVIVGLIIAGFYISNWLHQRELERITAANLLAEQQSRQALEQEQQHLADTLNNIPGLVVTNIHRNANKWSITGLLDPLGSSIQQLVSNTGLSKELLEFKLRPYLSLDPELLLKRAQIVLSPTPDISVSVVDSNLFVKGEATAEWLEKTKYHAKVHLPIFFNQIDLSGVILKEKHIKKRAKK